MSDLKEAFKSFGESGNALETIWKAVRIARDMGGSSDLHLAAGESIAIRVNGKLEYDDSVTVSRDLIDKFIAQADGSTRENGVSAVVERDGSFTLMHTSGETGPVRIHITNTSTGSALAIRLLPEEAPELDDLHFPAAIDRLAKTRMGLGILAGPVGAGKSTLLTAAVERINRDRACLIYTLEEGIEYHYKAKRSRFRQIEIGEFGQFRDYPTALRSNLRGDPDVVVVAECRDPESLAAAIDIAEAGRRCLLTFHLESATAFYDRIVGAFPPNQQQNIAVKLASVIQEVVVLRLAERIKPLPNGIGRVPACEILFRRDGLTTAMLSPDAALSTELALKNYIESGAEDGMMLMERHLYKLMADGIISKSAALDVAIRPDELLKDLERNPIGTIKSTSRDEW